MKYSLNWLRDFCAVEVAAEALAEQLTMFGFEVESLTRQGDDVIFDVDVVPVRGDCLSMRGLAREIAALTETPFAEAPIVLKELSTPGPPAVEVELAAEELCPRYSARVVTNLRVEPSPPWLAERLAAVGIRSLNNVVDITNYVNVELGQPLHAFDLAKITGGKLSVRRARAGEKLVLIDGGERELCAEDLVIADGAGPVALAGVMGGAGSEVGASTEAVIIESAYFDAASVRRTARRYGLSTESSYRFERGTDPTATQAAADRAAALLAEVAGGTVIAPAVDVGQTEWPRPAIVLRPSRANMILGTNLTGEDMAVLLRRLHFEVGLDRMENLVISVPSFRRDVNAEIDVIEEIGRIYGYENIEATLPGGRPPAPTHVAREEFERRTREVISAAGFHEVCTPSFTHTSQLNAYGVDDAAAALANPTVSQFSHLRPVLWPGLAEVAKRNGLGGAPGVLLFELGTAFAPGDAGGVSEALHVAILAAGEYEPRYWARRPATADFFVVKGALEQLARAWGETPTWNGKTFRIGEADGGYYAVPLEPFGVAHIIEVNVTALAARGITQSRRYRPISRFPSVRRDLALIVPAELAAAEVVAAAAVSSPLVRDVAVFDVFTGRGVEAGKKSLGIRLKYQADDRTLTDDEVNAAREGLLDILAKKFGATLRS